MPDAGSTERYRDQFRIAEQLLNGISVGLDDWITKITAILLKRKVGAIIDTNRVPADNDGQPGGTQNLGHVFLRRPNGKFTRDMGPGA